MAVKMQGCEVFFKNTSPSYWMSTSQLQFLSNFAQLWNMHTSFNKSYESIHVSNSNKLVYLQNNHIAWLDLIIQSYEWTGIDKITYCVVSKSLQATTFMCRIVHSLSALTHWGRDKMDAIWQTTFSNQFSWMIMYEYRFKFHWSLFLMVQLTIFQHWFR